MTNPFHDLADRLGGIDLDEVFSDGVYEAAHDTRDDLHDHLGDDLGEHLTVSHDHHRASVGVSDRDAAARLFTREYGTPSQAPEGNFTLAETKMAERAGDLVHGEIVRRVTW